VGWGVVKGASLFFLSNIMIRSSSMCFRKKFVHFKRFVI
jgi:hypothetical protein